MDHTIRAIQQVGVQANAKHIIGNEQETQRKPITVDGETVESYSANIDDRTLHELYLWPFTDAVHADVASVICAYSRVNSTSACENKLNKVFHHIGSVSQTILLSIFILLAIFLGYPGVHLTCTHVLI